jgi:hypothetical protein
VLGPHAGFAAAAAAAAGDLVVYLLLIGDAGGLGEPGAGVLH